MRTLITTLLISIVCLTLSACSDSDSSSGSGGNTDSGGSGGSSSSGSSSSGSGSSSGGTGPDLSSPFQGTYSGRLNAVARTDTLGNIRDSYDFTAVVNRNNRLRFRDDDGDIDVSTTVDDQGRFRFNYSADSTVCTGTIAVSGRIVDDTMSGSLSGPARCRIGTTRVSGTISGNFSGTR